MRQKHTYEFIQEYFKQHNCELLSTEYINAHSKLTYKCLCNNISEIPFNDFKKGSRCRKCSGKEKFTFEFVKNYFENQSCELLETEYINSNIKMKYICFCGNDSSITFHSFQSGTRCIKCGGREKLTFEFVKNYFENQSCELLETKYINTKTNMKYICSCDNISSITFGNFYKGQRCIKCSGKEKLSFEFVKDYFEKESCKLLETEYINNSTNMRYVCKCSNISKINFNHFQNGHRCMKCVVDKQEKSKHFKQYIFPSGEIRNIQGYENFTLDKLIKTFKEDDIITKRRDMPKILYEFKGKEHRYYPDIWIKSINKIIEVKSSYTYKCDLIKNIKKALATRKLNYDFEFWIYTREKKNIFSLNII